MSKHTMTVTIENDDGEEETHELPIKNEVCPECNGFGTHTNRNIDGNGITSSEWAEMCHDDPDFPDDYMSGMYDVTCEECHGDKVIQVPDEEACTAEQLVILQKYNDRLDGEIEDDYTSRLERSMGC